jgi:hypothetical protein
MGSSIATTTTNPQTQDSSWVLILDVKDGLSAARSRRSWHAVTRCPWCNRRHSDVSWHTALSRLKVTIAERNPVLPSVDALQSQSGNFLIQPCMWSGGIVPAFLTWVLDRDAWRASHPGCFTPGEIPPVTHRLGGWVGFGASLDAMEERKNLLLPGIGPQPSSPLLYRLSCYTFFWKCHRGTKSLHLYVSVLCVCLYLSVWKSVRLNLAVVFS